MKVKKNFMLRQVAGHYIVVPVGVASLEFNGVITLNETGAFMWKSLEEEIAKADLIRKVMDEYDVDEAQVITDVDNFIEKLKNNSLLDS